MEWRGWTSYGLHLQTVHHPRTAYKWTGLARQRACNGVHGSTWTCASCQPNGVYVPSSSTQHAGSVIAASPTSLNGQTTARARWRMQEWRAQAAKYPLDLPNMKRLYDAVDVIGLSGAVAGGCRVCNTQPHSPQMIRKHLQK
jgi:hypothetical protein